MTTKIHMHFYLILSCLLLTCTLRAQENTINESQLNPQAQIIVSEWFSIDIMHEIQLQKSQLEADHIGARYAIQFISDDQQQVNGILAMPPKPQKPARLALLLHPMGSNQNLWWTKDHPIGPDQLSSALRNKGFAVIALDARRHGQRKLNDFGVKGILQRAHSDNKRLYNDMIIGTVRDYRLLLKWAKENLITNNAPITVVGYSMGAQMGLLLAAYEPQVEHMLLMVPPYVKYPSSPVAPRHHAASIKHANTLLITANQDPYATVEDNQLLFRRIGSTNKQHHTFDSGHLLPKNYLDVALPFIQQIGEEHAQRNTNGKTHE